METNLRRKGQLLLIIGLSTLAAAGIILTRFHLDFISGIGYGIGGGTLVTSILLMRRGRAASGDPGGHSSTPASDPSLRD